MKNKTAVEFLEQQLYEAGWEQLTHEEKMNICCSAKLMEMEQIMDSYKTGARFVLISQSDLALIKGKIPTPEQYYNETFKSE